MKYGAESEANRPPLLTGSRNSSGASILPGKKTKLPVSLSGLDVWTFVHAHLDLCVQVLHIQEQILHLDAQSPLVAAEFVSSYKSTHNVSMFESTVKNVFCFS